MYKGILSLVLVMATVLAAVVLLATVASPRTAEGVPPLIPTTTNTTPTPPSTSTCTWDLNNDGEVGTQDLLMLIEQWGTDPGGPPDFDDDGNVGTSDLLELLANWGQCGNGRGHPMPPPFQQ